jgi:hypothetical protein
MNPRTCKLEPTWISWAREIIEMSKHEAYLNMPLRGVIFQIDKKSKTLVTLAELPCYQGSDTDILNHRTFGEVGYTIERPDDVITDVEGLMRLTDKIESESDVTALDRGMQEAVAAMKDMFDRRN